MLALHRNRTSVGQIIYAPYFYTSVPIYRLSRTEFQTYNKALDPFVENRSHVSVWDRVQLFVTSTKFYLKRTTVAAFIIDKTMLEIGPDYTWIWVAIEPTPKQVLGVQISRHSNMLVVEYFLRSLIKLYGKHGLYVIQMADYSILRHVLISVWNAYFIHL
jgi:hypothetical protein